MRTFIELVCWWKPSTQLQFDLMCSWFFVSLLETDTVAREIS